MMTNQNTPGYGRFHAFKSFLIVPLLLLVTVTIFNACNKKGEDGAAQANELQAIRTTDRLLTVANVVPRENGQKVEVWFYETPLIHHFSKNMANADKYETLLREARDKKVPVNMRLADGSQDQISVILPASNEQVRKYQENQALLAQQEQAEQVAAPDDPNARPALTAVIPNVATLNTIWNAVRNLCCQLPGPYAGGQCVPYQYVADGCYARAHKMRQVIEGTYGYTSYKVFNWADQCPANPGVLAVQATLWGNNCCVNWWYHVAPYVYVQSGSTQVAYLLDPSMHSAPVAITTWLNAQKNAGCGYAPTHKQAYYTSPAYAPNGYNYTTCAITVSSDNTYTAANNTCNAYSGLQGCF